MTKTQERVALREREAKRARAGFAARDLAVEMLRLYAAIVARDSHAYQQTMDRIEPLMATLHRDAL